MNDNKGSPTKKRKASDGRATADGILDDVNTRNSNDSGGFLSSFSERRGAASCDENNSSQLDRMEVMMMRMEEKLATVSSLESRCERLEAKCSSLENMLESTSQSTKEHIDRKFDSLYLHMEAQCNSLENRLETKVDSVHEKVDKSLKFHEYNEMLIKNQSWKYSAAVYSEDDPIFDEYSAATARQIMEDAQDLKSVTTKMRQGEFSRTSGNEKGVFVEMHDYDTQDGDAVNNMLLPHWKEFAAALQQFTPAINMLPDECESSFRFHNVQLNHDAMLLIKEALIGKPFQYLSFTNSDNDDDDDVPRGMSVDAILDIVESNKHLQKLQIIGNQIGRNHIGRLCSALRTHALMELDLYNCFVPGIGDAMLASLLTIDGLKLEKLDMGKNIITSGVSTLLADFLATNPMLIELNLGNNRLNDSDASLIANALRSNSTLRCLKLYNNGFTNVGEESLRLVLYDESSLNSVADSNHKCSVRGLSSLNLSLKNNISEDRRKNRGRKIYRLLSSRNKTMSNVQHFGDVDVKLLPNMLDAVQKYSNDGGNDCVKAASIVYEIMRFWDQVTPFIRRVS